MGTEEKCKIMSYHGSCPQWNICYVQGAVKTQASCPQEIWPKEARERYNVNSKRIYKYQWQFEIQNIFHNISEKQAQEVKVTGLQTWKKVLLVRVTREASTEVGTREPASEGGYKIQEVGRALGGTGGKEGTVAPVCSVFLSLTYTALGSTKNMQRISALSYIPALRSISNVLCFFNY